MFWEKTVDVKRFRQRGTDSVIAEDAELGQFVARCSDCENGRSSLSVLPHIAVLLGSLKTTAVDRSEVLTRTETIV